ncbi:MAG: DNA glycosylase AlkZ-like family protein [Candidatus Hodarchaeales archaeon]|jgi:uncharacterized protein YcaQ
MLEIIDHLSLKELRKIAISAGGLNNFSDKNKKAIDTIIKKSGMIQLDPINPAGRNHDLYFLSRYPYYQKGDFEKVLYEQKQSVFEVYFPNLMAVHVENYPDMKHLFLEKNLHPYFRERIQKFINKYPKALDTIIKHIEKNGPSNSAELSHLGKASKEAMVWKSSRVSGSGFEFLWLLGKLAIVKRDEQFKKSYDLINRYLSPDLLRNNTNNQKTNELEIKKFLLRQKYQPLLFVGNIDTENDNNVKIGKKKVVNTSLLLKDKNRNYYLGMIPNTKKGVFLPSNWESYLKSDFDDNIRAICPLDPIIHERELTRLLFNFDYVWEIYKKSEQRKWGYYVYPLLYQDKFIGRFEVTIKKGEEKVKFFNFQKEKSIRIHSGYKKGIKDLMNRWVNMIGVKGYTIDDTLSFLN